MKLAVIIYSHFISVYEHDVGIVGFTEKQEQLEMCRENTMLLSSFFVNRLSAMCRYISNEVRQALVYSRWL